MKKSDGFTLLEVLVSLLILCLLSLTFGQVMALMIKSGAHARDIKKASHLAQLIVEEYKGGGDGGSMEMEEEGLVLKPVLIETLGAHGERALQKISITIRGGDREIYSLSTLLLGREEP